MTPQSFFILLSIGGITLAHSATVATNSTYLQANGALTVTGGTAQGTTSVSTPLPNDKGTVSATGSDLNQTAPSMNLENFLLSTTTGISATTSRTVNSGAGVTGNSRASYTVMFNVGLNEQLDLTFDMVTTLQQSGVTGNITWSLIGPGGNIAAMSGSITATGSNVPISQQTATLTNSGSYTFTVTASSNPANSPLQNSGIFSTATINSMSLSGISSIPEPSITLLLGLSVFYFGSRRRRYLATS